VLETSALNDINHVSRVIADCAGIGVSFALDDFGTGYSSLTYLKRLPADQLKIDRSFVRDMLDDPEDLAILEGVLSLATAFHRQVVAEGVETGAQGEMLLQLGCELAQGYYIARPMPAEAFAGWVKEWRPDPAWAGLQPASHADLTLLSAGVELRAWVRELEEYLTGSRMTPPPLDRHQSRFGAWIRSEGHARYGDSAGLHALEESHRRLHTLAAELVGRQVSSDPARVISRLPEVHGLRDRILREITTLRHDPAMA